MPETWVGLAVALLALVPGFLVSAALSRARLTHESTGDLRTVLRSLAFSAAIQLLISPLTLVLVYPYRDELQDHPVRVLAWAAIAVLVAPGVVAVTAFAVAARIGPRRVPGIWGWFFEHRRPDGQFVVVHFKDGRTVAGVFAGRSAVTAAPETDGMYLESEWLLDADGDIVAPVPNSAGLLIPRTDEIAWLRWQNAPES